ncbi:unnamed protein product, partial [Pleuronectes platessa]
RVPPAGAVAEVFREKGPTRVQSRRRGPPHPVPSCDGRGPPRQKNLEAGRTPSLRRRGDEGDRRRPPPAARAQRFYHKYEHRPMTSVKSVDQQQFKLCVRGCGGPAGCAGSVRISSSIDSRSCRELNDSFICRDKKFIPGVLRPQSAMEIKAGSGTLVAPPHHQATSVPPVSGIFGG